MKSAALLALPALVWLAFAAGSRAQEEASRFERGDLIGIWTRPVAGGPDPDAEEGFEFRREGTVHLVGIASMNGLTWALEGDTLVIATNTERYPEPQRERLTVERVGDGQLVLGGEGGFAGSYRERRRVPGEVLPRSRAAAIDANLAAYERISGNYVMGDAETSWEAFTWDGHLRALREWADLGDYGTERIQYYLERKGQEDRLFFYRADKRLAAIESDRAGETDDIVVMITFGRKGKMKEGVRLVNGEPEGLDDWEPRHVKERFSQLMDLYTDAALSSRRDTFRCNGNEPFWSLRIAGGRAHLELLGEGSPREFRGHAQTLDYLKPPLYVWRGQPQQESGNGDLVAVLTREECRDTMADEAEGGSFSHAARVSTRDHGVLAGCCREQAQR